MPCATGAARKAASDVDASGTAVLASANTGMTRNAVQGASAWCSLSSSVSWSPAAPAAGSGGAGSAIAVTTPAMSALMPPRSRQYHSDTPASAYRGSCESVARLDSSASPAQMATAAVR